MQTTDGTAQGARSRATLIVGIVLAFGAGLLTGYLIGAGGPATQMDIPEPVYRVDVGASPVLGPQSAPVTVVLFTDFKCPFCKKARGLLEKLRTRYGDDIRIVFKHYPVKSDAEVHEAAVAAMAQGQFWAFHDRLFEHSGRVDRAVLERIAAELGMDVNRFRGELDRHAYRSTVQRDKNQGQALGVTGTPTLFINGRKVVGADSRRIDHVVKHELDQAREMMASGVPASKVYERIMKDAVKTVVEKPAPKTISAPKPPPPPTSPNKDPGTVYKVDLQNSTVLGKPDAPVTLVMYMDYQCAFSAKGYNKVTQLKNQFGEDLRVVYKNNPQPRHKQALMASEAALAAGAQGKFSEMHAKLFENREDLSRESINGWAKSLGLDMAAFKKAMDEHMFAPIIEQEQTLARSLSATSTPTFFINGVKLKGDQPYEVLEQAVTAARKHAQKLVAAGVDPKKVYEQIIAQGITAAAPPSQAPNAPI